MRFNIINLSDTPAAILDEEKNKWIEYLKSKWINVFLNNESLFNSKSWINLFNELMESNNDEIILFTSWWFSSINNIESLTNNIWYWRKIILWYSDLSHIQYKFFNKKNVDIIYWITLRNIFDLSSSTEQNLFNFINKRNLNIKLINSNIIVKWSIIWWHLMIFTSMYNYFWIDFDNSILFLEFHWLESHFIFYLLNVLRVKGVFNKINLLILDQDSYYIKWISNYFNRIWVDIAILKDCDFIPLFKKIYIKWENLIYED